MYKTTGANQFVNWINKVGETIEMSRVQVTGRHVLAARDLLGMEQKDLAAAAGVTIQTISRFENGRHVPQRATLEAIVMALENRGIEFSNGDSPGVKLRPEKAVIPLH